MRRVPGERMRVKGSGTDHEPQQGLAAACISSAVAGARHAVVRRITDPPTTCQTTVRLRDIPFTVDAPVRPRGTSGDLAGGEDQLDPGARGLPTGRSKWVVSKGSAQAQG